MTGFTLKNPSSPSEPTHRQAREQDQHQYLTSPSETTLASSTFSVSDKLADSDKDFEQQQHQQQPEPRRQRSKSRSPTSSSGIFSLMKKRNSGSSSKSVDNGQTPSGDPPAYTTTAAQQPSNKDSQAALTDLMSKYGPGGFIPTPVVAEKPRSPTGQGSKTKSKSPSPTASHFNPRPSVSFI